MPSLLRDWVCELPLMMQGVLVAAVRGCDGIDKEDVTKPLVREYRLCIMRNAKPMADLLGKGGFMDMAPSFNGRVKQLCNNLDKYPLHFITHLMHAAEIIMHKHPDAQVRGRWSKLYYGIVDALHLQPESAHEMDKRLMRPEPELADYAALVDSSYGRW